MFHLVPTIKPAFSSVPVADLEFIVPEKSIRALCVSHQLASDALVERTAICRHWVISVLVVFHHLWDRGKFHPCRWGKGWKGLPSPGQLQRQQGCKLPNFSSFQLFTLMPTLSQCLFYISVWTQYQTARTDYDVCLCTLKAFVENLVSHCVSHGIAESALWVSFRLNSPCYLGGETGWSSQKYKCK